MLAKTFKVAKEDYEISADVLLENKDLLVSLTGGDIPHLGGVVTFDFKSKKISKTFFESHDGRKHKDIFLAEQFAEKIKDHLNGNLCVTAGVHIDGITEKQIDASLVMVDELAQAVLNWQNEKIKQARTPQYTTHLKRDREGHLI
ncbi:hypothetical protein [Lactobacillus helveticus]|jgi:gallate decarboxylase subunit D|uniref:Prenylated flavin chaperone LpdD-like domain-containing protein n=2 Tax=Lactobacillus helveticus TaxID=1587 RepID=U4QFU3_LACHE|nr:hypothetical protein [Lactobacillus helveticus]ADX70179.1 Putative uncharacterized protein [Lactobacillus helveticus H10]ALI52553.1 hypothetical protein ALV80_05330 [Lactobacillus helveticus]NRN72101.1 hypothetical protein [Lactobacillus helveticus]NRN75263.1 hypothetical protein [Lactobacillus helveticus]NRN78982.1 hypothetical protein [Lactobacillus helveticus]